MSYCQLHASWLPRTCGAIICLSIWAWLPTDVHGDDWPFFRGLHCDGISTETGWVTRWPNDGPRIAWRKSLGVGVSSFVVAGDRVVTMSNQDKVDIVWCLHPDDGRVLWKFEYECEFKDHYFEGGTLSTPTIDGPRVYAVAYDGQVHCLHLENGELLWKKHLVDDFKGRRSSWDYAGSPLVAENLVILETGGEGNSTIALNKTTGEKIWGQGDDLAGYSSPIPFDYFGTPAVLVFKARAMVAYDRAVGNELWRIGWKTKYDVNASAPTVVDDQLFLSSGYGGRRARGALFRLEQPEPRQLWVNDDIETKMNSAVLHRGHVYCISERAGGQLMCVDLDDGNTVWSEPSFAQYGTLMIADGKLVILDEEGDLVIAEATPTGYLELARKTVLSDRCWVMPVLANGRIYVRNNLGKMLCLDVRPGNGR